MDCSPRRKYLYLTNLVFSEKKMDSYYSVPTLGNLWTYVKQGWCYKFRQLIMTWYMNLLTFSYLLQYASGCCLWPSYAHQEMFCNKLRTLPSFSMYIQSIVSNYFLNTLRQTSNIYLEWSLQLMWFFWFFNR